MLPPIPASLVPVTPQHDVPKPRPEIPPVTPAEPGARESEVALEKRHPQETAERLAEEQQRRQRHARDARGGADEAPGDAPGEPDAPPEALGPDDEPPRLGGHVNVSV